MKATLPAYMPQLLKHEGGLFHYSFCFRKSMFQTGGGSDFFAQASDWNALKGSYLSKDHFSALPVVDFGAALICRLPYWAGPAAISWPVSVQWVDPIKRGPLWPDPHIGDKFFKAGSPFFANKNAARSIFSVAARFRIFASLDHCSPRIVRGGLAHAMGFAHLAYKFFVKAPAATYFSASKRVACYRFQRPAIALAYPFQPAASRSGIERRINRNGDKSAISNACPVNKLSHIEAFHQGRLHQSFDGICA